MLNSRPVTLFRKQTVTLMLLALCGCVIGAQPRTAGFDASSSATTLAQGKQYQLAETDLFTVVLYDHPELSGDYVVPIGGVVVFPLAGELKVSGLTVSEVSKALTKLYGNSLLDPNVAVILKTPHLQQVTVMGDVQKPGPVPILPGQRLADAVSSAGGLLPDLKAVDTTVTILERGGKSTSFALPDVLHGDAGKNLLLTDGETITIDSGTFIVYVIGQVTLPGAQHMNRGAGILEAIASAGGPTPLGAISKVRVVTLGGKETVLDLTGALVHGAPVKLPEMHRGDLITVPQNTRQVAVLGYVAAPGIFPMPEGIELRLSDAVALAKGHDPLKRASLSRVVVTRIVKGKAEHTIYNLGQFARVADLKQNPVLEPGDLVYVPETNSPQLNTLFAGLASIGIMFNSGLLTKP